MFTRFATVLVAGMVALAFAGCQAPRSTNSDETISMSVNDQAVQAAADEINASVPPPSAGSTAGDIGNLLVEQQNWEIKACDKNPRNCRDWGEYTLWLNVYKGNNVDEGNPGYIIKVGFPDRTWQRVREYQISGSRLQFSVYDPKNNRIVNYDLLYEGGRSFDVTIFGPRARGLSGDFEDTGSMGPA